MDFRLISELDDKSAAGIVKAVNDGVIANDQRNVESALVCYWCTRA